MPNKNLAQRYLDAWNAHDVDKVLSFFAQGATYIDSGLHQQVSGNHVGNHLERILDISPDASFEMLDGSTIGNGRAVIQWRARGHNISRWCPQLAPDELDSICGLDYIHYERGKLISTHVYFDLAHMMAQIEPQPQNQPVICRQYQKSGLSDQDLERYHAQLDQIMQREQLYLDNELTLGVLAEHLGLSSNHLSQVINSQFNLSFYELLNYYRVQRAKELLNSLAQDDSLNSLDVAFEAGFGSASAFYRAFQRHTNLTPTAYRKRYC